MRWTVPPDVARAFVEASRMAVEGALAHDLDGPAAHVRDVGSAIAAVVADARIDFDEEPLPFPEEPADTPFPFAQTPLREGVRRTIEHFRFRGA